MLELEAYSGRKANGSWSKGTEEITKNAYSQGHAYAELGFTKIVQQLERGKEAKTKTKQKRLPYRNSYDAIRDERAQKRKQKEKPTHTQKGKNTILGKHKNMDSI